MEKNSIIQISPELKNIINLYYFMKKRYRKKEHLFLKDKPIRILKRLNREEISYATSLSSDTNSTYTHVVHILQDFEKLGLIESRWDGRTKLVKITQKGQGLSNLIENIEDYINSLEPKPKIKTDETQDEINLKLDKLKEVEKKLDELRDNFGKYKQKYKYVDIARKVGAYKKQFRIIKSSNDEVISFKERLEELSKVILAKYKKLKQYNLDKVNL